jgi:PAS domain S-box-containing protein
VTRQDEIGELVGGFNQLLHILGQRETELRQSEEFKSGILNAMNSHSAVLDHNGVIVAVNARWSCFATDNSNLPGQAAPHTGIGVNYLEVCQGLDDAEEKVAQIAHDGIQQVLQGRLPSFSLEYPCHSPHEQRWFHLMATPVDASDEPNVVIVHTDITEQKLNQIQLARYRDHLEDMVAQQTGRLEQSNAALRESESLFRLLALNTSDGLAVFENNLIVYVSPTYLALLGFEKQEEMGRGEDAIKALIHPDDVERVLGAVYSAMQSKLKSIVYTYRARHKKGHYIWREDSTRFTYDDQGQPHRIYVVARDVTESVLSQRAMEEHQLSLQVCFDNQQTGSAVFSETGLLYCNPAFRSLLGYTAKQSLSHLTMEGLVPSADRTYLRARHKRAKAYGETLSPKLMKLTGNEGATVTCLVSGSIVAWSGEPQFLASVTPLGDSVLVEQEIRASEERYERLLVTQLEQQQAHIARELHDSLGSRLAGVAMLLGGVLQKSPELGAEMKVALDQVQIAAQASRVLAHSLVPVDALPGAFWRSLQRLCLDYAKLAGVQCLFSMNGGFEEVDAETGNHLFRIAQEALVNAVKHGHASRIEVRLEVREDCLAMTVVDNGRQLSPQLGSAGSSSGIGLKSMQARAKIIGGAFKWYVNDDGGITVSVVWGLEPI